MKVGIGGGGGKVGGAFVGDGAQVIGGVGSVHCFCCGLVPFYFFSI